VTLAVAAGLAGIALAPVFDQVACRVPREPVEHAVPGRRIVLAAVGGALLAAVAVRFSSSWALPAFLMLAAGLLVLSVIDIERFLLPNAIVYPLAVATVSLLAIAAVGEGDAGAFVRAVVAAVVAGGVFAILHLAFPDGLAAGDVKLAAVVGLGTGWLGWGEVVLGFVLAFVVAAAVAGALVLFRRRGRRDPVPFGPFLAAGALAAVLIGNELLNWYTGT
jgi:leader peptidase (prepilin peptidase) / N-methyltransferase